MGDPAELGERGSHSPANARGVGGIGIAVIAASALGLILLMIVRRLLGEDAYALFLTVWGVIFGISTAFTVVEQEVSRRASHDAVIGRRSGRDVARVTAIALAVAVAIHLLIILTPVRERLYGTDHSWVLAGLVALSSLAFVVQFAVRGVLIGHGRTRPYALVLAAEAIVRLAALALMWWLVHPFGIVAATIMTITGAFVWLLVLPAARERTDATPATQGWSPIAARTLTLGLGTALSAALLTGFPSIAALVLGSSVGLGPVFSVITATRVPLVLVAPVQAVAIPAVVRTVEERGTAGLVPVLVKGGAILAALTVAGFGVGWLAGPWIVRLMFAYDAPAWSVAAIAASTVLIGAGQLLCAVLVALDRHLAVAMAWGAAALVAVVVLAVGGGSGTFIVTCALSAASIAAVVVGVLAVLGAVRAVRESRSPASG